MDWKEALRGIWQGESIVFLGAGFSRGAENLKKSPFKTGNQLAEHFCALVEESNLRLEDAAEAIIEKNGVEFLVDEVGSEFTSSKIADFHQSISTLPWKRVYTTNYDDIYEVGAAKSGKRVTSVTLGNNANRLSRNAEWCVHLNGSVRNLNKDTILAELKLTDTSYITSSLVDSSWLTVFVRDMRMAKSVFFVGYSLSDLDIKRAIVQMEHLKDKTFFIVGPEPSPSLSRTASKFGELVEITTEQFAEECERNKTKKNPFEEEFSLLALNEFKVPEDRSKYSDGPNDRQIRELLIFGDVNPSSVYQSATGGKYPYYLERSGTEEIFSMVEKGRRSFAVSSDLGNGKSLLTVGSKIKAKELGYRVFELGELCDETEAAIEKIARLDSKVFFVIEGYQAYFAEIATFVANAGPDDVLLLTARNAVHDVVIDELNEVVKNVYEIKIDHLTAEEVDKLVKILDDYGLWGGFKGQSEFVKKRFVQDQCNSQLHAVLLKLLNSKTISQRVDSFAAELQGERGQYKVILSILILSLVGKAATLDVLSSIWGAEVVNSPRFRNDSILHEMISFHTHGVHVRSPIVAEYLVRSCTKPTTTVEVLIKMVQSLTRDARFDRTKNQIVIELARYAQLQTIFGQGADSTFAIMHFYETLKSHSYFNGNYHFWLQYAIAALVAKDLERSKTYFKASYSIARKRGCDTFKIDNHYARLLMESALSQEKSANEVIMIIDEAQIILDRQMTHERRHYPYRVATAYRDIVSRHENKFKKEHFCKFKNIANHVSERIYSMAKERKSQYYISECELAMRFVLRVCADNLEQK